MSVKADDNKDNDSETDELIQNLKNEIKRLNNKVSSLEVALAREHSKNDALLSETQLRQETTSTLNQTLGPALSSSCEVVCSVLLPSPTHSLSVTML